MWSAGAAHLWQVVHVDAQELGVEGVGGAVQRRVQHLPALAEDAQRCLHEGLGQHVAVERLELLLDHEGLVVELTHAGHVGVGEVEQLHDGRAQLHDGL